MKALIYKDLVALKKTGLLSLVILAVVCFIGIWQEAVLMLPFIFVLVPVILLWHSLVLIHSPEWIPSIIPGPIKHSTIVLSRYSFVWLMALIGILFTVLLKIFTGDGALEKMPWHLIVATMLLLTTFIAAIQIPQCTSSSRTSRLVFVVLYFIIFVSFFSYWW